MKTDLTELFRKYKSDSEIYHDLMQFRVREILLVTTVYDAFILEQEDQLTEKIFGEYYRLNLLTAPRITSVPNGEDALNLLLNRHFDMVILTIRINDMTPFELSPRIKLLDNNIPVFLLLYDNNDIKLLRSRKDSQTEIDRVFVWNRDSKIFLAMIKYIEDKINVDNDTKVGLVRVILLVENSVRYYSRYLPALYTEIIKQTLRLMKEERLDEMKKIMRLNARPKVLMAVNYEEAIQIFEKFKDYLLCVISDVKFPIEGKIDELAGVKLIKYVKSRVEDLPSVLQSSDSQNFKIAAGLKSGFINKNSERLSEDLTNFIFNNLGFGDFIFRDDRGHEIVRASTMKQLKNHLKKVPNESLLYHASRNHFSAWLMARGEIQIAKQIQPIKVTDFPGPNEVRSYLVEVFNKVAQKKTKGKIVEFEESILHEDGLILRLSEGSLGGKGRGIAFTNTLIHSTDLPSMIPGVNIKIPKTVIIGTQEFDYFIENNQLKDAITKMSRSRQDLNSSFETLKKYFISSDLSKNLIRKLSLYLKHITRPLAVRSSGLFEDSLSESFSGVYQTYLLPNNDPNHEVRLKQLEDAIKLVYASVYSKSSRSYFEAINYRVEEEKMAVVIQEVVGSLHQTNTSFVKEGAGDFFYPHFSGVAQSHNYYPISHMKPVDGIAVIGVGLGKYVIDGERAYRFCPKYPKLEITSPELQLKNSQSEFYSINMNKNEVNLLTGEDCTLSKLNISEAEHDGTLEFIASVWDAQNNRITVGLDNPGPRIINFARILKYDAFPLAKILEIILELMSNAMGSPVEIEFAVNLGKTVPERNEDTPEAGFYLLQIKPLIRQFNYSLPEYEIKELNKDNLLLYTEKGMGNGLINDIQDVIYVDPGKFDRTKTVEMAAELESLNEVMKNNNRKYILIGPGRWGTRDRWLGIPVVWAQISNARIIVETGLKDFTVDASLGSHFFHNITSMNIGYFTIPFSPDLREVPSNRDDEVIPSSFIDFHWLRNQKPENITKHFIHLCFTHPLKVLMDGKKSISVIYKST